MLFEYVYVWTPPTICRYYFLIAEENEDETFKFGTAFGERWAVRPFVQSLSALGCASLIGSPHLPLIPA